MMKLGALVLLLAACFSAQADCASGLRLKGFLSVPQCDPASGKCVPANEALYANMRAAPDDGPTIFSIATHGSPWHLYDPEYRILEIDDVAALVRQQGSKIRRVDLVASWSGAAPDSHTQSLARRLSTALGGMPVTGQDGFMWVSPKGKTHTTHQAFTGRVNGPYWVGKNDEVMASLVPGWVLDAEDGMRKARDGAGLLHVAAAKEIFMLCPEGALQSYEEAAALDNPIAAFNAAILRLERGGPGDAAAAAALLKQAAAQGDKKAGDKLRSLVKTSTAG